MILQDWAADQELQKEIDKKKADEEKFFKELWE